MPRAPSLGILFYMEVRRPKAGLATRVAIFILLALLALALLASGQAALAAFALTLWGLIRVAEPLLPPALRSFAEPPRVPSARSPPAFA